MNHKLIFDLSEVEKNLEDAQQKLNRADIDWSISIDINKALSAVRCIIHEQEKANAEN